MYFSHIFHMFLTFLTHQASKSSCVFCEKSNFARTENQCLLPISFCLFFSFVTTYLVYMTISQAQQEMLQVAYNGFITNSQADLVDLLELV